MGCCGQTGTGCCTKICYLRFQMIVYIIFSVFMCLLWSDSTTSLSTQNEKVQSLIDIVADGKMIHITDWPTPPFIEGQPNANAVICMKDNLNSQENLKPCLEAALVDGKSQVSNTHLFCALYVIMHLGTAIFGLLKVVSWKTQPADNDTGVFQWGLVNKQHLMGFVAAHALMLLIAVFANYSLPSTTLFLFNILMLASPFSLIPACKAYMQMQTEQGKSVKSASVVGGPVVAIEKMNVGNNEFEASSNANHGEVAKAQLAGTSQEMEQP